MSIIDRIITSKIFNLLPNFIRWIWRPINKRQTFLWKIKICAIFDDANPEWDAYEEVYGSIKAHAKYGCRSEFCPCIPVNPPCYAARKSTHG